MLFRYMLRELRNSPRFALLFILNLCLGLVGFVSLDALKHTFDDQLQASARTMLGADLVIEARRPILETEKTKALKLLPSATRAQDLTRIFTMAAHGERTALIEVRAIEPNYPFYGDIILKNSGVHRNEPKLHSSPALWIAPELALKLDLKKNNVIRIGEQDFKVADIIQADIGTSIGSGMAPRVYMSRQWLTSSGLMQKGNTARHSILFQLPADVSVASQLERLEVGLPDPSLQIESYKESGQGDGRILSYLSDYLGLVALVAFSLASIGAAYLYRAYFEGRNASIAILISLGLTHQRALVLYMIQICFLGVISAILSWLLAFIFLPILMQLIQELSPIDLKVQFPLQTLLLALILGGLGSLLICLPMLNRLRYLKPSLLFHDQPSHEQSINILKNNAWLAYLPVLIAFYLLAMWQANSIKVGSLFFVMAIVTIAIFAAIGWLCIKALKVFRRSRILTLRIGSLFLSSRPASTISIFIAIGLASTLMNLIPQIQQSLLSELESPEGQKLPSFFLFDIQEDQLSDLQQLLENIEIVPQSTSPMITARLAEVNGAPFTREIDPNLSTREAEREQRFRNRGVNLSYRSALARGESITEGSFFKAPYSGEGIGEISIEKNYANRLGLKMGDTLMFDVQGLEIEAKITSFRKVKWTTFEPNFFIILQPGLIDDAPKTYLMNIPDLPLENKMRTQAEIVKSFPNISIIDVSELISRITLTIHQMTLVLNVMALLTTITGLLVIYSIAQHQALARRWDHNLLKILGAKFPLLLKASFIEFGSVSVLASIMGGIIGITSSFLLSKIIFESVWSLAWQAPLIITFTLVTLCLITAIFATLRILRDKPALQIEA